MLDITIRDPHVPAKGCVLWMHGLGADGADMAGLAVQPQLAPLPLRHIFLDAPVRPVTLNAGVLMRAWYDIHGLKITDKEDKQGILASQALILEVLQTQLDAGFTPNQIFLAGFSQGGAMALYTSLHYPYLLGGVIALSAYLPIAMECKPQAAKNTPIFIASGLFDPIILPDWTKKSEQWLLAHGYHDTSWHSYPIEHTVCIEEMGDLALWLAQRMKEVPLQ